MPTLAVSQLQLERQQPGTAIEARTFALGAGVTAGLALLAIAIEGYHPYSDDGGLYLAGVERLLHPSLFPHYTAFVVEQTRFSGFAWIMATVIRATHAGFQPALFVLHFASIWATLFAGWLLAVNCWASIEARVGAVSLLACSLSLPVAGTSLAIMDPYLTARSFSTPLGILALSAISAPWYTDGTQRIRGWALCLLTLALSSVIHPVMSVYTVIAVLLLACMAMPEGKLPRWAPSAICFGLIIFCFAAHLAAPPESSADTAAALTRTYWFASQWAWYELAGLIAPLAILGCYTLTRAPQDSAAGRLSRAALYLGVAGLVASLLFAHPDTSSHLIARLQPLRVLHIVYVVLLLVIGAELGKHVLKRSFARWACAFLLLSCCMYLPARAAYSHSAHIELQLSNSPNQWVQAFLWARDNTPVDALFALDSEYNDDPGADTQIFRAIAERSALPDRSKDGGVAAMDRELAPVWLAGATAQKNLDHPGSFFPEGADRLRRAALRGTGVDWLVLTTDSPTALLCPYRNEAVKVCHFDTP